MNLGWFLRCWLNLGRFLRCWRSLGKFLRCCLNLGRFPTRYGPVPLQIRAGSPPAPSPHAGTRLTAAFHRIQEPYILPLISLSLISLFLSLPHPPLISLSHLSLSLSHLSLSLS